MPKNTQQLIAERAGVSRTTVSRALRNIPGPNRETVAKVVSVALELGYRLPSTPASLDRRKKAHSNWLSALAIVGQSGERMEGGQALQIDFMNGLVAAAQERRIHMEVEVLSRECIEKFAKDGELPEQLKSGDFNGVLLFGRIEPEVADRMRTRLPCVRIGSPRPGMDVIGQDNLSASHALVSHLQKHGHSRIGFLAAPERRFYNYERFAGYMQALALHHLPSKLEWVRNLHGNRVEDACEAVRSCLNEGITAWICAHDGIVYNLAAELRKMNIRVPDDVSLCGFDAISPPKGIPQAVSIRWPLSEMAEAGVKLLEERIKNPGRSTSKLLFDGYLQQGESVREI